MHQYSKWEYQNIALAAVAQCAALVDSLAIRGAADESAMAACIDPLFNFNPASVDKVYSNVSQLNIGLRTVQNIFSNEKQQRNGEMIRYLLGLLVLRQKLMSDKQMQAKIHRDLEKIIPPTKADMESFEQVNPNYYQQLANIYQHTISTYSFRIQVRGNIELLKDEIIANKIRALLLAGIRSAVLWYQLGGRRWHLIFYRKRIRQTTSYIRRNLITTV